MFIEIPLSKVVVPSIDELDNIDEMGNIGIISFHDGPEDHDVLRDVRDYTSRIDFDNDITYGHTISIVQSHDQAITEILTKIHGLTQASVLVGEETPGAPVDGVDGQQFPTDDDGGQQPAAAVEAGSKEKPLER